MPDLFFNDPDVTVFRIHDSDGNLVATLDAIDILSWTRQAKTKAEKLGNFDDWFLHFQKTYNETTGTTLSKSQSAILINEAEKAFQAVKKKWARTYRVIRDLRGTVQLSEQDLRRAELVYDAVEAEDELTKRLQETELTPDRYYQLLVATGVEYDDAESARAAFELRQLKAKSNGKNR